MSAPPSLASDPMPEPPASPDPNACCDSGCDPCIYDLYERAMDRYRLALQQWRDRHPEATSLHGPVE